MADHLEKLAAFVCDFRWADVDPAAIERTKWVVLDSLTAIALGMQVDEMQRLTCTTLGKAASGRSWVVGTRKRANPMDAALLNGTAGTWLELNEGNLIAKGHPGIQVVPVALAFAQQMGASGAQLLRAILMGYEVACRVGRGSQLRIAVHPHGTYGAIGAAVAVGVLKGYDSTRMLEAMRVAATLGLATSRRTLLEGSTVRNVYTGHSGVMGIWAADMVDSGFTGEASGVATAFGEVLGEEFDETSLSRDLGRSWLMNRGYFKLHCTGRYVHSAIDALLDAFGARPVNQWPCDAIRSIRVSTFALASMLNGSEISTSFGARFSIPFALATLIHHGKSDLEAFSDSAVSNPMIQSLSKRVVLEEVPAFTARYPQEQVTEIEIEKTDGETLNGRCEIMRGELENPYPAGVVEAKYDVLAERAWGADVAARLKSTILQLEPIPDVDVATADIHI